MPAGAKGRRAAPALFSCRAMRIRVARPILPGIFFAQPAAPFRPVLGSTPAPLQFEFLVQGDAFMKGIIAAGLAGVLSAAIVAATPARADAVEDYYKGKQVKLLVGFGAGGTYSHYAHLIARAMPAYIPGKPTIVVQNMPGAGGIKMTNYAYNVAPKDGSVFIVPPDSIIISELATPKAAKYKTRDFTWIGNLIETNSIVIARTDAGATTVEDTTKKQLVISSTGKGSQTFLIPAMMNGVFGSKFKIIMGYKGSKGALHAIELNEAQGTSLTWLSYVTGKPEWFQGDRSKWKVQPVVQIGFSKERDLPWVPLARDLARSKEDRQIVDFFASLGPVGRGMAAVPGTDKAKVDAMRASFDKMVADPAMVADAEKRKLRINAKSGKEVQAIVNDILGIPPALVKRAAKMLDIVK
jgi:tripartite-type tricarboxylate transporter receptor subunit TctC